MTVAEMAPALVGTAFVGGLYLYMLYLRRKLRLERLADPKNEKGR